MKRHWTEINYWNCTGRWPSWGRKPPLEDLGFVGQDAQAKRERAEAERFTRTLRCAYCDQTIRASPHEQPRACSNCGARAWRDEQAGGGFPSLRRAQPTDPVKWLLS